MALEKRARIRRPGQPIQGKVVEPVYAFDQLVIPAGSEVTGHVTKIAPVPGMQRTMAYANGDFTPFHKYEVSFDTLILPSGLKFSIATTVSPGTAEVIHLVTDAEKAKQKTAAAKAAGEAKQEAKRTVQEAKNNAHEAINEIKAPGKMHRIKEYLLAQLPIRRQYIEAGTRFNAELGDAIGFGEVTRQPADLASIGAPPPADSELQARLESRVSSATAHRGTPVAAVITAPLYAPGHELILPANSRLVGEVLQAKPAGMLHHNGNLRVTFERIELPDGVSQAIHASLEGLEVDRAAHMKIDEEGGTYATDSKARYLQTGLSVAIAVAAGRPDVDHGTVDPRGD
ncbi:MAG: hypothetical protein WAM96_09895, partial [Candidatus Acidiferrales bacterium]